MLDVIARNKELKKQVSKIFGSKNVSVRNSSGTAWGWCLINVDIPKPADCECNPLEPGYCKSCATAYRAADDKIEEAIKNEVFYEYSDDEGYSNKEYNTSIHLV